MPNPQAARPEPRFLPTDPRPDPSRMLARSVTRAVTAAYLDAVTYPRQGNGSAIAARAWPGDSRAVAILQKAATVPATTTQSGWAAELSAVSATTAFFANLAPASAAATLFAAAVRLSLDGVSTISVPYPGPTPTLSPSFVAEGAPIPVRQAAFTTVTLGPAKALRVLTTLSNELADRSIPAATQVIEQIMVELAARSLDAAVLSATPGDSTRPPGLLYNVTPIAPTTGGGINAASADIGNMLDAIAAAGGGRRAMLFLAPGKAASLATLSPGLQQQVELVPAPTLPVDDVVMVDPGGVLSGYSGEPIVDVGKSSTLHMENTTPLQISTPGSPNTVAAPGRSMFQTDSFALRLILRCAWAARPGFVQVINSVTW